MNSFVQIYECNNGPTLYHTYMTHICTYIKTEYNNIVLWNVGIAEYYLMTAHVGFFITNLSYADLYAIVSSEINPSIIFSSQRKTNS